MHTVHVPQVGVGVVLYQLRLRLTCTCTLLCITQSKFDSCMILILRRVNCMLGMIKFNEHNEYAILIALDELY